MQCHVSAWTDIAGRLFGWHREALRLRVDPKIMEHNTAVFECIETV